MTVELSIVVPTLNERDNVESLVARLEAALEGIAWEVIIVDDDSVDGTFDTVRAVATRDARVRCLRRIGRRGLSSACLEGLNASAAAYLAVMDADGQHDEALLPRMLAELRAGDLDLVVGSRYVAGGSTGDWSPGRERMSRIATCLGRWVLRQEVADPMSGFFMLTREHFDRCAHRVSGVGYKILLDVLASSAGSVRCRELGYRFRPRRSGASKLDSVAVAEYLLLLYDKTLGFLVPPRFLMFVTVGAVGALLHLTVLGLVHRVAGIEFLWAQSAATAAAIVLNFSLNNLLTYRERRLRGLRFAGGLASFALVCTIGAAVNLLVADFLYQRSIAWWIAGLLGAVVGAVWNYAVSSSFVWTRGRAR